MHKRGFIHQVTVACLLLVMASVSVAATTAHTKSKVKHTHKPAATAKKSSVKKTASAHPSGTLRLESASAIVVDATTGAQLFTKNANNVESIASITKLMTAMVVLDANAPLNEVITIDEADVDMLKHTTSRLPVGTTMKRYDMLRLALMSSENRAASSLSRHYPGGKAACIEAMEKKAQALGMGNTHFKDTTGLNPQNMSTAEDLAKMVHAASRYPLISEFTTTAKREVQLPHHSSPLDYKNTNALVRAGEWDIKVSKTGYTQEAGRCLVMMTQVSNRPVVMVLLESQGKLSPVGDATRIKNWLESSNRMAQVTSADKVPSMAMR